MANIYFLFIKMQFVLTIQNYTIEYGDFFVRYKNTK